MVILKILVLLQMMTEMYAYILYCVMETNVTCDCNEDTT